MKSKKKVQNYQLSKGLHLLTCVLLFSACSWHGVKEEERGSRFREPDFPTDWHTAAVGSEHRLVDTPFFSTYLRRSHRRTLWDSEQWVPKLYYPSQKNSRVLASVNQSALNTDFTLLGKLKWADELHFWNLYSNSAPKNIWHWTSFLSIPVFITDQLTPCLELLIWCGILLWLITLV